MQSHGKIAFILVAVGVLGMAGWRIAEPYLKASTQAEITDASALKATISVAVDGWVGYFPLCSPEIKKRLRRDGYGLQCVDDSADYKSRFRKLDKNEYDFVVATVDSYVLNGSVVDYPGAIIAVLDESKGGDAIVGRKSVVPSLESLKSATDIDIAYTPNSPSHHLVKSVATHFDVPVFKEGRHYRAKGSEDAYRALKNGEADVAVLWEPDVSRALADDDFVRILGTEDTKQLIVDILIASRRTAKNDEAMIVALLKNYFTTLKYYSDNKDLLKRDLSKYVNLSESKVEPLLDGVRWVNLSENAESWFGLGSSRMADEALVRSIESAVDVLVDNRDFSTHPLPNQDPYRLVNSQHIERLYQVIGNSGGWTNASVKGDVGVEFVALSDGQWNNLQEVGSLKARKISFASGTSELTEDSKARIDELIRDLKHYPTFRVEVRGHTGTRGDAQVNIALSQERSEAVTSYMRSAHGVDNNRVRALGFGGSRPLAKKPNESSRAYRYRLPRVELILVRETI